MLPDQRHLAAQAAGPTGRAARVSLHPWLCGRPPVLLCPGPEPLWVPPGQLQGSGPNELGGERPGGSPSRWLPLEI